MSDSRFVRRLEAKYRAGLAVVAGLIFVAAVMAALSGGNDESATPVTTTSTAVTPAKKGIEGFSSVAFSITPSDGGSPIEHCGLLAESQDQQAKGLMYQSDIGGYPAMIFRFAATSSSSFYMANVPVPLSIAWFDDQGKFVSSAEMEPCKVEAAKCPRYGAKGPYRYALEASGGGLSSLGIGDGSVLQVGSPGCT